MFVSPLTHQSYTNSRTLCSPVNEQDKNAKRFLAGEDSLELSGSNSLYFGAKGVKGLRGKVAALALAATAMLPVTACGTLGPDKLINTRMGFSLLENPHRCFSTADGQIKVHVDPLLNIFPLPDSEIQAELDELNLQGKNNLNTLFVLTGPKEDGLPGQIAATHAIETSKGALALYVLKGVDPYDLAILNNSKKACSV